MSSKQSTPRDKKPKKSYANCPPIQLILRDNKGWRLYKQHHKSGKLSIQSETKACADADISFSTDGTYFTVIQEDGFEVYESLTGTLLATLAHYRVRNISFSPRNNFIVSYHHRRHDDKHGNCWVWKWDPTQTANKSADESKAQTDTDTNTDSPTKVIYQFFLPEFDKKRVPFQFTNDECIAARITRNSVLIHDVKRLHFRSNNIIGKLDIANVASVVVAPTRRDSNKANNSYILAVFALPKNNKAATVTIYEYQYSLAMNKKSNTNKLFNKISQRAFYGVDTCELLWDPTQGYHHNLLAIASSDVDTSGKSYYGNQTLFLLSSRNNITVKIPISEKGKLQDVKWHCYGKEFVMIDDHPQKISIFDYKGNNIASLGKYARNLIRFSSDGRFLWCGGFGNLTGEMTFYDFERIKNGNNNNVLGYNTDDACRFFQWSPDSSTFLTARLYPYMTVDNGFRVYKYNGQMLCEETFERLYQIGYRPSLRHVFPAREPSPGAYRKGKPLPTEKTKKRYMPPHMRGGGNLLLKSKVGQGSANVKQNKPKVDSKPKTKENIQKHYPTLGGGGGQKNQNKNRNPNPNQQQTQPRNQAQSNSQSQSQPQSYAKQSQTPTQKHSQNPNPNQKPQNYGYNQQKYAQQNYQQNYGNRQQNYGNRQQNYGQQQQQQQQQYNPNPQQYQYNQNQQHRKHQNSSQNQQKFQSGVYHQQHYEQQQQQTQQSSKQSQNVLQNQFNQMNINNNASAQGQGQAQAQGNVSGNNNNNTTNAQGQGQTQGNDGNSDGQKKKKRRKRNKNKSKGVDGNGNGNGNGSNNNSNAQSGGGKGPKPGLADNDNRRWARGSKQQI